MSNPKTQKYLAVSILLTVIVAWIQLDDLSHKFVERHQSVLEAMNATTWARRQFTTWHLLYRGFEPLVKPFDGLDKMILLSWVMQKLTESQPFVLHYWDLHGGNIIIDEQDNLKA